jgi:ABC-type microcin C transport system duplicated ATPase subunit YejF
MAPAERCEFSCEVEILRLTLCLSVSLCLVYRQMDSIKKRELIFPRLFEFVHRHGMTLILISHDVPLVCKLVDTVYVMHHGECVQSGSHRQLMGERGGAYARLVGAQEEGESNVEPEFVSASRLE